MRNPWGQQTIRRIIHIGQTSSMNYCMCHLWFQIYIFNLKKKKSFKLVQRFFLKKQLVVFVSVKCVGCYILFQWN